MRNPNPNITTTIKTKTLSLLMTKDPKEIGMRDIARNCGITAANIYHYYEDKDALFREIALDCLNELNVIITQAAKQTDDPKQALFNSINAFSDWCFTNPRKSILVMTGIESAADAPMEIIRQYYVCNNTGLALLQKCIESGIAKSSNPAADVGILIHGVWGCIESVLLKKSDPIYWNDGRPYAEHFINLWASAIFIK